MGSTPSHLLPFFITPGNADQGRGETRPYHDVEIVPTTREDACSGRDAFHRVRFVLFTPRPSGNKWDRVEPVPTKLGRDAFQRVRHFAFVRTVHGLIRDAVKIVLAGRLTQWITRRGAPRTTPPSRADYGLR